MNDKCSRMESKKKKLLRSQTKEKSRALELRQAHGDLQQLAKVRCFHLPPYVDQDRLLLDKWVIMAHNHLFWVPMSLSYSK